MIDSVEIHNFQSHKYSKIDFHPGVNVIVGTSNSGKSAILRALFWAKDNRPSGTAYVSHWNRNEKGDAIGDTSIVMESNGHRIARVRSNKSNGYFLDGVGLDAVGLNVPDQVKAALNLDSVNVQRQMDAPFLLSNTAGEVAEYFNGIIRLDIIDTMLSKAESSRRSINKNLEALNKEKTEIEKEKETYNWIEYADALCTKISNMEEKRNAIITNYNTLESISKNIVDSSAGISELSKITMLGSIVNEIDDMINANSALNKMRDNVKTAFININESTRKLQAIESSLLLEHVVIEAEKISDKIAAVAEIAESIATSDLAIKRFSNEIDANTKLIPDMCPLCGSQLEGDKCAM
jgi:DNA repair protein SbcC/Rad50